MFGGQRHDIAAAEVDVPHSSPEPAEALTLALSADGVLHLRFVADAAPLDADTQRRIEAAFAAGPGAGLLHLGVAEIGVALPQPWAFWRDFAARLPTALCRSVEADATALPDLPAPHAQLAAIALSAPAFPGATALDADVLASCWQAMVAALQAALAAHGRTAQAWLTARNPRWHALGRIHLHLAEHRADPTLPFAFMATLTTKLSASAQVQHIPLHKAVAQASGGAGHDALLAILQPLQRAAAQSPWLAARLASGALYAPQRWTAEEAFALLQEVPALEDAGLVVRMPQQWRGGRPARPTARVTLEAPGEGKVGADAMLAFALDVALDGEPLSGDEVRQLLQGVDGLQLLRGQWVEVDHTRLQGVLSYFEAAQRQAAADGVDFRTALKLLAGGGAFAAGELGTDVAAWAEVVAGPRLAATLAELRDPGGALAPAPLGPLLRATLRPYQVAGVAWLHLLTRLGLGACLADDMGLGKTVQVLALLLTLRRDGHGGPALAVVPASLLGNWQGEAAKFAPSLRVAVAHSSAGTATALTSLDEASIADLDLVLTTYGMVARDARFAAVRWRLVLLDEAQAIKNPGTRQSRAVKALRAPAKVAMTGTPVENNLLDLWSLMDVLNPGLLGGAAAFARTTQRLQASAEGLAPLRRVVQPYLLRRKKTDRAVICDLPDKTEVQAFCGLSKLQLSLYKRAVQDLQQQLDETRGNPQAAMARRGLVLSFLMRFKQICNHPSHWLGDGSWSEADSGKFVRLREIAEVVSARQDKMLVFTQFRETIAPLHALLRDVFGRDGLTLHGDTPVTTRQALVQRFASDPNAPFFVLSLKAGGTGLNLTAAAHVVHFDRWWNPAVEDQATDRAYRIGQHRNVLVHKFVCRGTIEERIDALIAGKRAVADAMLQGGAERALTELSDGELMAMVALDFGAAQAGG